MNPWDEWRKQQEAKIRERLPKPKPPEQKEPAPTRPITEEELAKLKQLQKVSPAWWCGDGRFIGQFAKATSETQITERQAFYIKLLWYKYRRQLGHNGEKPEGYIGR